MTDQLVQQAQRGDVHALEELCRREWRPVYSLLYRAVRDRAEAEDLTQEVFLRALRSFDRFRDTGTPFRAYLVTIARNLVRERWRRRTPALVDLDVVPHLTASDVGPEEAALKASDLARVEEALSSLSVDHRTVIRLRVVERRPTQEVAELMDRSPNAIRQLQYRATIALRAELQKDGRV